MPEELARPSQPASDPDRSLLNSRIPAAAPVPPNTTAPHPSAIQLPSAMTHREQRAAEVLAIEAERRRADPRGEGRDDVDWLGRATGAPRPQSGIGDLPAPTGPVAQPLGVPNALPTSDEPPSFTDLLRIPDAGQPDRPFDWAVHDDATGEVPAALTSTSYDTTTLGAGSWSLTDDQDDDEDVVSGEIPVPAAAPVPHAGPVPPTDRSRRPHRSRRPRPSRPPHRRRPPTPSAATPRATAAAGHSPTTPSAPARPRGGPPTTQHRLRRQTPRRRRPCPQRPRRMPTERRHPRSRRWSSRRAPPSSRRPRCRRTPRTSTSPSGTAARPATRVPSRTCSAPRPSTSSARPGTTRTTPAPG